MLCLVLLPIIIFFEESRDATHCYFNVNNVYYLFIINVENNVKFQTTRTLAAPYRM